MHALSLFLALVAAAATPATLADPVASGVADAAAPTTGARRPPSTTAPARSSGAATRRYPAGPDGVVLRVDGTAPPGAVHLAGPYYRAAGSPARWQHLPGVIWAAPDSRRRIRLDALDPLEPLQWHLANDGSRTDLWPDIQAGADIDVDAAWSVSEGDPSVVIAVLDTGFPPDHPDLPASDRVPGWDFVDNDADPSPVGTSSLDAHGLAVAALALAPHDGTGVVGVCPRCRLLPVRVIANDATARDGDLVGAVAWAAERADVINASWSYDANAYVPASMHDALRWAAIHGRGGRGCVVVFSAGNLDAPVAPYSPQAMVETLTVGASDERNLRTPYSNTGAALDLLAPGGSHNTVENGVPVQRAGLVTADLAGDAGNNPGRDSILAPGIVTNLADTATFVGTSGSAPLVAGAAGLLLSIDPDLTAREVAWILTASARKIGPDPYDANGHSTTYGYGLLDVGAAVAMLQSGNYCHERPEICDNGIDDDCDRLIDGADPDCGASIPQPFQLPLGIACTANSQCGDGYCTPADGNPAGRICSAFCDFDCPSTGACVGPAGQGHCLPTCHTDADCAADLACATPDASLVPPTQWPVPVCLPRCTSNTDCQQAHCMQGVCGGNPNPTPPSSTTPSPSPARGCACSSRNAPAATWLVALLLLGWMQRRRRRAHGLPVR